MPRGHLGHVDRCIVVDIMRATFGFIVEYLSDLRGERERNATARARDTK
jgi:hypothetical protein